MMLSGFAVIAADRSTYWATMAQVLVVIALAVVVEARALIGKWDDTVPDWVRGAQALAWSLALVLIFISLDDIVKATRPDSNVPTSLEGWSNLALNCGIGVVIGAPALDLIVRGFARPLSALALVAPAQTWRMWRLHRRARRAIAQRKSLARRLDLTERDLQMERVITERERQRALSDLSLPGISEEATSALNKMVTKLDVYLDTLNTAIQKIKDSRPSDTGVSDIEHSVANVDENWRALQRKRRAILERVLRDGEAPSGPDQRAVTSATTEDHARPRSRSRVGGASRPPSRNQRRRR